MMSNSDDINNRLPLIVARTITHQSYTKYHYTTLYRLLAFTNTNIRSLWSGRGVFVVSARVKVNTGYTRHYYCWILTP